LSKIEVNTVAPQCGTTLGESGDTVTLGSGASQSGFGRTGTVDWDTTPKTATFTAVSGDGFFCNTTGGAFTCNLPAGAAGAIVSLADYAGTWDSNALTVSPNGSEKIGGTNADVILTTEGQSVTFVYVDSTQGWINVQDSTSNERGNAFIIATGGTITTSGNCKIHTFTGPGTFTVSKIACCAANNTVSHLVVAGGGGSGGNNDHIQGGGGGGAGGFREVKAPSTPYTASPLDGYPSAPNRVTVTATGYPITVGGGGTAGTKTTPSGGGSNSSSGANSVFSTITAAGGGRGGQPSPSSSPNTGDNGGSGGGGSYPAAAGGTGNTPPVTPSQGNNGGAGSNTGQALGGSGGGATGAGSTSPGPGTDPVASTGGAGATTNISASPVTYSTGGDYQQYYPGGPPGTLPDGADNSGNGGDGQPVGPSPTMPCAHFNGHNGGSGIVIIRYKYQS
jgi:hypothetical protein